MNQDPHIELTNEERNQGYKVMATKVHPLVAAAIEQLCRQRGITVYELLQLALTSAMRYMSQDNQLDYNLERLISMFFSELGRFSQTFRTADPSAKPEVTDAICFLGDQRKGEGRQSVLVSNPWMGEARENWNVTVQLEAFISMTFPEWYKKLRLLGTQLGTSNFYETIQHLILHELEHDTDAEFLREIFSDNRRGDFGQQPNEDGPYKRHFARHDSEHGKPMFRQMDITDALTDEERGDA